MNSNEKTSLTCTKSPGKVPLSDFPAGVAVFLVALPLCLGIALASGAPLFSGIISGIVGGIVIGVFSGSPLSVSGPAAGLAVIVAKAIQDLGDFSIFTVSVLLCGLLQLAFAFFKLGRVGSFFPTSVIKGMLAGIGVVIGLKQIPYAMGLDKNHILKGPLADLIGSKSILGKIVVSFEHFHPTALTISITSLLILVLWDSYIVQKLKSLKIIPGALLVVIIAAIMNCSTEESLRLTKTAGQLVTLPTTGFLKELTQPEFSALTTNVDVYVIALLLAIIASLETLLSVEAVDKLDPYRRTSDTNKELFAQGIGNIVCGLIGGLPVTAVIVRSSANVYAGGTTRISAIFHGFMLLLCVIAIPKLINLIPLASLATVLIIIGYKLSSPKLIRKMWKGGKTQFIPFIITLLSVVIFDLLTGVLIGLAVGLYFAIVQNLQGAITVMKEENSCLIRFNKDMTFMNKAELKDKLLNIPENSVLIIEGLKSFYIDQDIIDFLVDFKESAPQKGIEVTFKHFSYPELCK